MRQFFTIVICCLAISVEAATLDVFYKTYLPDGVRLGMSPEELHSQRRNAAQTPAFIHTGKYEGSLEMVEPPVHGQSTVGYWYRFKGGKLGAITRSSVIIGIPEVRVQGFVAKILDDLKASFERKGEEKILRSTGAVNTLLTAQLWENKSSREQIYLVASNSEITLVIFNPKLFGKRHFFIGEEKLKAFEAQAKELSKGVNAKAGKPPTDILLKLNQPKEK